MDVIWRKKGGKEGRKRGGEVRMKGGWQREGTRRCKVWHGTRQSESNEQQEINVVKKRK